MCLVWWTLDELQSKLSLPTSSPAQLQDHRLLGVPRIQVVQCRRVCTCGFLGPWGPWGSRVLWADPEQRQLQALASGAPTLHCPCVLLPTDCTGWAGNSQLRNAGTVFQWEPIPGTYKLSSSSTVFKMKWIECLWYFPANAEIEKNRSVNCAKREFQALQLPLQRKCWLVIAFRHSPVCWPATMFLI